MHNYILPIIWSFYTYVIGKTFPFVVFIATLVLFWFGGYDFPRSPTTAAVIVFDIISTLCIRIMVLQSIEYSKYNNNNDIEGVERDHISDIIGISFAVFVVAGVCLFVVFNKI